MPKYKGNLNAVYISERLQECLRPIAGCALTTIIAPMGYGKTTAINWYLNERGREGAAVLRVSIYSANRAIFWKSLQKAFAQAGLTVLEGYECPTDASGAALLLDDLCTALAGEREIDLFLDDFHLLWNTAGRPEPAALPTFADVTDPDTAKAAQWCMEAGFFQPREDGNFKPGKHVSRWKVLRTYQRIVK